MPGGTVLHTDVSKLRSLDCLLGITNTHAGAGSTASLSAMVKVTSVGKELQQQCLHRQGFGRQELTGSFEAAVEAPGLELT